MSEITYLLTIAYQNYSRIYRLTIAQTCHFYMIPFKKKQDIYRMYLFPLNPGIKKAGQ